MSNARSPIICQPRRRYLRRDIFAKPELYHFNSTRDERELNALTSDALKIELFSPNGVLIYSSMIDSQYTEFVQTTESLYANCTRRKSIREVM